MAEGGKVNVDDDNSTGKKKANMNRFVKLSISHDHHCKFVACLRIITLTVLLSIMQNEKSNRSRKKQK